MSSGKWRPCCLGLDVLIMEGRDMLIQNGQWHSMFSGELSMQGTRTSEPTVLTTFHYNDVIMSAMLSEIIIVSIVCSTVNSGADQGKLQSSTSLAFVRGIHRWPANNPHKRSVTSKMYPFDDVIMFPKYSTLSWRRVMCAIHPLQKWFSVPRENLMKPPVTNATFWGPLLLIFARVKLLKLMYEWEELGETDPLFEGHLSYVLINMVPPYSPTLMSNRTCHHDGCYWDLHNVSFPFVQDTALTGTRCANKLCTVVWRGKLGPCFNIR